MWSLHTDAGNSIHGGQYAKNVYLGETRIVTKLCLRNDPRADAEELQQYFYHSDHLGSASLISDYKGDEYQRIEYTPYGETWIERTDNKGLAYLPYKFTAKELDPETGLYYFGARYLDSKYSTWISTDPALGDYIPQAPINDEARKHNQNLPGMGGIFNHINSNLYAYGANNPVRYIDPTGRSAGDLFDTLDAAAEDFGKTYNDDSIRNNVEYGTTLYKNKDGKYYYSVPNKGDNDGVSSYTEPLAPNDKESGRAHTHGAYDPKYRNNEFSNYKDKDGNMKGDIPNAKRLKRPTYVATPNGSFRKYTPSSDTDVLMQSDMPSDPKDPARLNKNDAHADSYKDDPCNE